MPFVQCPGCSRQIEVFPHEYGTPFECAVCGEKFTPVDPGPPPESFADIPSSSEEPEPSSATGFKALLVVAVCLLFLSLGVFLILHWPGIGSPGDESSLGRGQPPPTGSNTTGDPYPECAAIRAYALKNANDPDAFEVVEWLGRDVSDGKHSTWDAAK
jgi:hypothetical protein